MREYLVEVYVPRNGAAAAVRAAGDRARESAEQLSVEGTAVRYVRAIFVAEDETCFYVFEADSAEAVQGAAAHAGFPSPRIVQALEMFEDERS